MSGQESGSNLDYGPGDTDTDRTDTEEEGLVADGRRITTERRTSESDEIEINSPVKPAHNPHHLQTSQTALYPKSRRRKSHTTTTPFWSNLPNDDDDKKDEDTDQDWSKMIVIKEHQGMKRYRQRRN